MGQHVQVEMGLMLPSSVADGQCCLAVCLLQVHRADRHGEWAGPVLGGGLVSACWMGTWNRCFLQPFPSGLPVLLSGVTAREVTGLWQKPLAECYSSGSCGGSELGGWSSTECVVQPALAAAAGGAGP